MPSVDVPLLEMKGITKSFPGVRALQDVSLEVGAGEVHALVGENGAGKSTLIRILGGIYPRDAGQILLRGLPVEVASPTHARQLGISIIHQELNQVPALSVAENIFLGREPRRVGGLVDWDEIYARAGRLLADLGVSIDPRRRLGTLTVAEQQLVEIAKALSADAAVVVMDEPTAPLTLEETERLFGFIRDLRARGVGIIYITHRLQEVFKTADRVTVLRDGQYVGTYAIAGLTMDELISLMVGRRLTEKFPKEDVPLGPPVLDVRGLTVQEFFRDVSFILRHGEILGIAGLIGSGKAEVAHAIFGATPLDAGEILLDGRPVSIRSAADAIALGIGLVTEDRKRLGLVLSMSVRANITLPIIRRLAVALFIRRLEETALITQAIRDLDMAVTSPEQIVRNLSGGTQQKVVVAKWLQTRARVLLMVEPTRGIDVGAKVEIYHLMVALARRGVGIVMVSSEMEEILGMSDRILVMHEGVITAEFPRAQATQEGIMASAAGRVRSAV
ncbi:MAG: sugar ABC transporter ATP-binding protein [Bacillati bacterium ANGP1]|uniref:Sugar ABC transporter ATP-binding protein n=1 Tax=Candidatus Segetimicrobium genomatis TaxID=2569760 RepID=A0A537IXB7_9BACT|nr:MAG: sugar ABC transporter ATP-binding protein [Terrabacteria group bacterium ANGP1]